MGCSDSKETQTQDQSKQPAAKPAKKEEKTPVKKEETQNETKGQEQKEDSGQAFKNKNDVVAYLVSELDIKQDNAEKIVANFFDSDDDSLKEEESKHIKIKLDQCRDELLPLFKSADTNGTGKVSTKEACTALAPKFPNMNEDGMKKMFKSFEDGEKCIQPGEFILFYIVVENAREQYRPVFMAADENGTGVVTLTEAADKLCEKFPNMDERSVKKVLYRCGDRDGKVEYEQFIIAMAKLKKSKKAVLKKFEALPKDSDGMVQESEVIQLLMEETKMDEDDCKAMVNKSDEENDSRVSAEEFINTWSKMA